MKTLALNALVASVLVLAPIKATLIVTILLLIADLITGVLAARKRGEAITSSGFKRTVIKMFVYEGVVILSFLVETFLVGDILPVVKIVSGMVGLTELKSVLENLEAITGLPLLQMIIDRLSSPTDKPTPK